MRRTGAGVSVFVMFAGMLLAAGPAQAETACSSDQLAKTMPAGAAVDILAARGAAIPSGRWPLYRHLSAVIVRCLGPGTRLTVRSIGPNSLASPPVFAGTVPIVAQGANPLLPIVARRKFEEAVLAAIDNLAQRAAGDDDTYNPIGALAAAGTDFATVRPAAGRVLVMVFNGWVQSKSINLFSYASNPRRAAPAIIARLRADDAMPDLQNAQVLIAGISPGDPRMRIDDVQLAELCGFWRVVTAAAHGRLAACGASLPGVAVP